MDSVNAPVWGILCVALELTQLHVCELMISIFWKKTHLAHVVE